MDYSSLQGGEFKNLYNKNRARIKSNSVYHTTEKHFYMKIRQNIVVDNIAV